MDDRYTALPGMSPRKRSERALRKIKEIQKEMGMDDDDDEEFEVVPISELENESDQSTLDQNIFMNAADGSALIQESLQNKIE